MRASRRRQKHLLQAHLLHIHDSHSEASYKAPCAAFRGQAHTAMAPECDGAVGLASRWCATAPAARPTYPGTDCAVDIPSTMSRDLSSAHRTWSWCPNWEPP